MNSSFGSESLWENLHSKIGYLDLSGQKLVFDAYVFSDNAHSGQKRRSGEPYIIHPVAVAEILAELHLDPETLAAGLLHDTVEDSGVTFEELEEKFGPTVRMLVEGETKVSKLPKMAGSIEDEQAENLRQMFVAMTEDVRVIVIKLADRLHNMRTLEFMPAHKRTRIARETLEIFAPLANRLGMSHFKWELEDLAFREINPEAYHDLAQRLEFQHERYDRALEEAQRQLTQALENDPGLKVNLEKFQISGRAKHLYSIWRKMQRNQRGLEQIYDLLALRVILVPKALADPTENTRLEKQLCYQVLGMVHSMWQPMPSRVKDYIAMPKPNGYQSLHTTVLTKLEIPLEIQIRTESMHRVAEYGVAAHWLYKEAGSSSADPGNRTEWLMAIQEWDQEFASPRDFVEAVTRDLLSERVYVFTPKGQIVNLPKGSTAIDFAYHIHTDIGHRARGARIDGKIVPLSRPLQNGEVIEIITAPQKSPSRDWLDFVRTRSAREKIRHFFRDQERDDLLKAGRSAVERAFRRRRLPLPPDSAVEEAARTLMAGNPGAEEIYLAVARGALAARELATRFATPAPAPKAAKAKPAPSSAGVYLEGSLNTPLRLAECCRPLPGDPVLGYITRGRGVSVHRADCPNLGRLLSQEPERCLGAWWGVEGAGTYPVKLRIQAQDRTGLLSDLAGALAQLGKSISHATTATHGQIATLTFRLQVKDEAELETIQTQLLTVNGVISTQRA